MRTIESLRIRWIAAVAVVVLSGCETLTVPDFNNPGLDGLTENPTRENLITATQGLMIGAREGIGEFNRYVSVLGTLGRESYIFDASDTRFIDELLKGPLDPGGASFGGGGHWADRYTNIRMANLILDVLAQSGSEFFSDGELAGIRGFAGTMQAHDFLLVLNTRWDFGAPIDVGGDATGAPAAIADSAAVFNHILQLLDDGLNDLNASGSAFPFTLSGGFSGFDTPATFAEFNRALKARVLVYRREWNDALTALGASFIDTTTGFDGLATGVYHSYGTAPGDVSNGLVVRRLVLPAHPSIGPDAQAGDERLDRKTEVQADSLTAPDGSVKTDRLFTVYDRLDAPIPYIRNEELILLRAEANLQLGNLAEALDDINYIRRVSGGLPPIASATWNGMTATERIDELLYNRRYSLLYEGHRWIDARRYDRLDQLPRSNPNFVRFSHFPFPEGECVARPARPAQGCDRVVGF